MKKYNFDFIGNKKILFGISISIIIIGIIFNLIFGTELDIQFTGGSIVKYSYAGDIDESTLINVIQDATEKNVTTEISDNLLSDTENNHIVSIEFSGTDNISLDQQKHLDETLTTTFSDNNFEKMESSSVDASMGKAFFLKCLAAILLASVLMVLYVALRFKKISGLSAGVMALIALIHDVIMVYFTFIIFRIPLNDNFIAVVLMILGYSLNDTIVIYDRIRENRKKLGPKVDNKTLVNSSINQTLNRTINTSISTVIAIATVLIVAIIYNLPSVISFALPMVIGIISGCYSTICIAGPLWVMWQDHKLHKVNAQQK